MSYGEGRWDGSLQVYSPDFLPVLLIFVIRLVSEAVGFDTLILWVWLESMADVGDVAS